LSCEEKSRKLWFPREKAWSIYRIAPALLRAKESSLASLDALTSRSPSGVNLEGLLVRHLASDHPRFYWLDGGLESVCRSTPLTMDATYWSR
jgi:hypothetical protein